MAHKLNKKASTKKLTNRYFTNALYISLREKLKHSHIILHKTKEDKFTFTFFWIDYQDKSQIPKREAVSKAIKDYKTKKDCIVALKKFNDAIPPGYGMKGVTVYDYNGDIINTEIHRVVTRYI